MKFESLPSVSLPAFSPLCTCDIHTQDGPARVMGAYSFSISRWATTRWTEQSSQRVEGEEEKGKGAQRHTGTVQHANGTATCCRLVRRAYIWLTHERIQKDTFVIIQFLIQAATSIWQKVWVITFLRCYSGWLIVERCTQAVKHHGCSWRIFSQPKESRLYFFFVH